MDKVAAIAIVVAAIVAITGIYTVDEGHVGVLYRGGALLDTVAQPGFNFKIPLLDVSKQVQVTLQTDSVQGAFCGTSSGSTLVFEKIEVVNRLSAEHVVGTVRNYSVNYDKPLIFDRVAHVVSEECSTSTLREIFIDKFSELDDRIAEALRSTLRVWAPGVEVIAVRASKPKIPPTVLANFEAAEAERTKLGIAKQRQHVLEVEAQTKKLVAEIEARTNAAVSNISMAMRLLEQEGEQRISAINNDVTRARATAEADAEHYRVLKLAEADEKRLTPQFLQLTQIQALANASKVYFGDKLPSMYVDRPTAAIGE